MTIAADHHCKRCGEITLRRHGRYGDQAVCARCALMLRGEYTPPVKPTPKPRTDRGTFTKPARRPLPRIVLVETKIDTSKYVPGTPPSPFMLDQLYREACRSVRGTPNASDPIASQSYRRKVSAIFHRKLRDLGVPMEGA